MRFVLGILTASVLLFSCKRDFNEQAESSSSTPQSISADFGVAGNFLLGFIAGSVSATGGVMVGPSVVVGGVLSRDTSSVYSGAGMIVGGLINLTFANVHRSEKQERKIDELKEELRRLKDAMKHLEERISTDRKAEAEESGYISPDANVYILTTEKVGKTKLDKKSREVLASQFHQVMLLPVPNLKAAKLDTVKKVMDTAARLAEKKNIKDPDLVELLAMRIGFTAM